MTQEFQEQLKPVLTESGRNPSGHDGSASYAAPLAEFATRQRKASRLASILALSAACLWLVAAAFGATSLMLEPSVGISELDVPIQILEVFDKSTDQTSFMGVESAVRNLFPAMKFLGGIVVLISIFIGVVQQRLMFIMLVIPMALAPYTFETLLGDTTEPSKLLVAVKEKNYDEVESILRARSDLPVSSSLYVFSQIALAQNQLQSEAITQAANLLRNPASGIAPKGQVAYAIELAADGQLKTQAAMGYYEEATSNAAWVSSVSLVSGKVAGALSILAVGAVAVAVAFRRRLLRLKGYLDYLKA